MPKRLFDIVFAALGLALTFWLIIILYILAGLSTRQGGFFFQERVGQYGRKFIIIKLRSMKETPGGKVTTPFGVFMRKFKLDELPQLYNVLRGQMSFVGPRPDVPGYYDKLTGNATVLLQLKPGITGPASIKYANEEALLATVPNPLEYNDAVIFPDKVKINLAYYYNRSLWLDIKIIAWTIARKMPDNNYFE